MARRVIIIESSESSFRSGGVQLAPEGLTPDCERISWAGLALDRLAECRADLLMVCAVPEPPDAVRVFRWLAAHPVHAATFAVLPRACGHGLLQCAAQAVDDFVLWPARYEEVRQRISRIGFSPGGAEAGLVESMALAQMVGRAPAFVEIVQKLPRVAMAEATVLLWGETGTGKELCARALHFLSRRRSAPFIPVDCG